MTRRFRKRDSVRLARCLRVSGAQLFSLMSSIVETIGLENLLKPLLLDAPRPSALFALTQTMTIGALKTIWEVGLDLPKGRLVARV